MKKIWLVIAPAIPLALGAPVPASAVTDGVTDGAPDGDGHRAWSLHRITSEFGRPL